jgi:modulator of FtsH protease
MVMATDIYHPGTWDNLFQLVGTGAAALTGLIFVSISLNLDVIAQDANHRYRAICNLTGLTHVFMICALATMGGQDHLAVGAEWLVIACIALTIYISGYIRARRGGRSSVGLSFKRLTVGVACYVVEIVGAVILVLGHITGIYVASVAMIINVAFFISGAWLLMVGVQLDLARQQKKPQSS